MSGLRYFHKMPAATFERLSAAGATWNDLMREWLPPRWCGLGQQSMEGFAGCWSLVGRKIHTEIDCRNCDQYCGKLRPKPGQRYRISSPPRGIFKRWRRSPALPLPDGVVRG